MEVDIEMIENENFLEQEEKFLKGLLGKYHTKNSKEEKNLEEEIKRMEEEDPSIIEESKEFWDNLLFEEDDDENDLENEEVNTEKVMFVNPKQVTTLRKDPNFISADKYPNQVVMTGEIGSIANTRIVTTKKVALDTTSAFYTCPIIKLTHDDETEKDTPALTVYLKRDPNVEVDRKSLKRSTEISIDEFYTVAVSDDSKVVLAEVKK